jgi:hypothetical protein
MSTTARTRGYWLALRALRGAPNGAYTRRWLWRHVQRETPRGTPLGALLLASGAIE